LGKDLKRAAETAIGSSGPLILQFFLATLRSVYNLDIKKIRYELNLRADQDPLQIKRFWVRELRLPLSNFKQVNIDERTKGRKTDSHYKVCAN
jgi:hypothetical protein